MVGQSYKYSQPERIYKTYMFGCHPGLEWGMPE